MALIVLDLMLPACDGWSLGVGNLLKLRYQPLEGLGQSMVKHLSGARRPRSRRSGFATSRAQGARYCRNSLSWLGRHELGSLLSMAALAVGLWTFVAVADEMQEGDTHAVDRALMLALRNPQDLSDPIGPRWLEEIVRDLTALGGMAVLSLISVAVICHLALARKPRAAAFVAASVSGALALSLVLKGLFQRPRPDLVPQVSYVASSSFPSGHSMLSAAVYLTLGALLARFQSHFVLKAHVLGWATMLTFLVGGSRVYLGVHWPSDVFAGWAAGAAWAALCWLTARTLQRETRRSERKKPACSNTPMPPCP
jgi:undecaprenyl-diphosphatase